MAEILVVIALSLLLLLAYVSVLSFCRSLKTRDHYSKYLITAGDMPVPGIVASLEAGPGHWLRLRFKVSVCVCSGELWVGNFSIPEGEDEIYQVRGMHFAKSDFLRVPLSSVEISRRDLLFGSITRLKIDFISDSLSPLVLRIGRRWPSPLVIDQSAQVTQFLDSLQLRET